MTTPIPPATEPQYQIMDRIRGTADQAEKKMQDSRVGNVQDAFQGPLSDGLAKKLKLSAGFGKEFACAQQNTLEANFMRRPWFGIRPAVSEIAPGGCMPPGRLEETKVTKIAGEALSKAAASADQAFKGAIMALEKAIAPHAANGNDKSYLTATETSVMKQAVATYDAAKSTFDQMAQVHKRQRSAEQPRPPWFPQPPRPPIGIPRPVPIMPRPIPMGTDS